jgi:hypothetical protein
MKSVIGRHRFTSLLLCGGAELIIFMTDLRAVASEGVKETL